MKIKKINSFDYNIYVYSNIIDDNNIIDGIKVLIKKLQRKLKLHGFYKVEVCKKEIGLFIELIQIDKSYYMDILELKIEIKDIDIYYKTIDYFIIKDLSYKYFYQDYYYGLINDNFFDIMKLIEFGEFVFGKQLNDFLQNRIIL